jgi:hypothetical protein
MSMERCLGELTWALTGTPPSVDCLKFGVSKGLVRRLRHKSMTKMPKYYAAVQLPSRASDARHGAPCLA